MLLPNVGGRFRRLWPALSGPDPQHHVGRSVPASIVSSLVERLTHPHSLPPALSTVLDAVLAVVISVDLLSAKKKNDVDGHGHADVSSTSPVLSRLISVTRRNSSIIALVQAICLYVDPVIPSERLARV